MLACSGRATSAGQATSAPAGATSGGSSEASTIRSAAHTRSACFADLNDNPIRLLGWGQRHGLRRRRQGECEGNGEQPDHCYSPVEVAENRVVILGRASAHIWARRCLIQPDECSPPRWVVQTAFWLEKPRPMACAQIEPVGGTIWRVLARQVRVADWIGDLFHVRPLSGGRQTTAIGAPRSGRPSLMNVGFRPRLGHWPRVRVATEAGATRPFAFSNASDRTKVSPWFREQYLGRGRMLHA